MKKTLSWRGDSSRRSSLPGTSKTTLLARGLRPPGSLFTARRRRHPLTPPLNEDDLRAPKIIVQETCAFLMELPYEIRELVYMEILGDRQMHVQDVEEKHMRKRMAKAKKNKEKHMSRDCLLSPGIIAMLCTCRLIYLELHHLLIRRTILHFPSSPSLLALISPTSTYSTNFSCLRNINLHIYLPYLLFPRRDPLPTGTWASKTIAPLQHFSEPLWVETWTALASLRNLRYLKVCIGARDYRNLHGGWPERPVKEVAEKLWRPVFEFASRRKQTGVVEESVLKRFEVEVSWSLGEEPVPGWRRRNLPFSLKTVCLDRGGESDDEQIENEEADDEDRDGGMSV